MKKLKMPTLEYKSISLIADYSGFEAEVVINALTRSIAHESLEMAMGIETECYDNHEFMVRSKELYNLTLKDGTLNFTSESSEYLYFAITILYRMGIHHSITNICFNLHFEEKLEDVANVFTSHSPEIPLNESMFIIRDKNVKNHSSSDFLFNMPLEYLKKGFISEKSILDCFVSCKATYDNGIGVDKRKVIKVDDVIKMDFKGDLSDAIDEIDCYLSIDFSK
jgi:hypothetical protein